MPLGDFVAGTRTLDLSSYTPAAGTYSLYVKAVGKPSLTNKMSNAASITIATNAGVSVATPLNGSTLSGSPVHVMATASSPNGVASMIVYLDYNDAYLTYTASVDTYLSMAPGSHLLVIKSWDNVGNVTQATSNITVSAAVPSASLSLSTTSVALGKAAAATVSATDPNVGGSITSSVINWGDGTSSAGPSASHTYSTSGTYTVKATVTDNYGNSASALQALTVQLALAPTASMTVAMSGATATVTTAGSIAGSGTIASTVINWGDGASTVGTSASHTYAKGGYYTLTVTVTNSFGLSASTSQQVTAAGVVIWLPQAGSTASVPVHIAATAYDSKPIASMIVYLDGVQVWLGYVNDLDLWQSSRNGSHTIVVKAWESGTGVVYQSSVKFNAK
jgi:PKD repeat protein